jgi:hypothetical protein
VKRDGSNNIPKSPRKAARKTSEHLELIRQELIGERAARPNLPGTPRNLPRAARTTSRHRVPNGLGIAVSRCEISRLLRRLQHHPKP